MLGNDPLGDAAAWRGQPGAQRQPLEGGCVNIARSKMSL
jgi:hypothetical protein